jgi:molecular chaperone Hsp33
LSIKFDRQGIVTGAGGLFLQAMPDAADDLVVDLEQRVNQLPSLGEKFSENQDPESLVQAVFKKHSPQFLANRRIEFMCHCSKKRLQKYLSMLPPDDIRDIRQNGPFPLELRCHLCNTAYEFSKAQIQAI